jgi:hypothetical protein
MLSIQDINGAIMSQEWTNTQLSSMIDAVKYARARLGRQTKASLMVGDNVNFTSSKTGQNVTGVVMKIAIKYVTVKTVAGLWRVPANMLTKIEEEWTPDNADFNDPGSRHHY